MKDYLEDATPESQATDLICKPNAQPTHTQRKVVKTKVAPSQKSAIPRNDA